MSHNNGIVEVQDVQMCCAVIVKGVQHTTIYLHVHGIIVYSNLDY